MNFSKYLSKEINPKNKGVTSDKNVEEDMLSITDSPGFIAVNPEAPGQIMQTPDSVAGGMDTMSLAGPQKKVKGKKAKKKKAPQVDNRVVSFADFMQKK
jgi:hypothetical protein